MNIGKEKIEEIAKKIMSDKTLAARFKTDPAKLLEELLGVNLPNDQVNSVIKSVTAKVGLNGVGALLDSDGDGKPDLDKLAKLGGGLFGKK